MSNGSFSGSLNGLPMMGTYMTNSTMKVPGWIDFKLMMGTSTILLPGIYSVGMMNGTRMLNLVVPTDRTAIISGMAMRPTQGTTMDTLVFMGSPACPMTMDCNMCKTGCTSTCSGQKSSCMKNCNKGFCPNCKL